MFHTSYKFKSLEEATDLLRNEVRGLFAEVSKLITLLIIIINIIAPLCIMSEVKWADL